MSESEPNFVQAELSDDEEIYKKVNTKSGSVLVVAGEQPSQHKVLIVNSAREEITKMYVENIRTGYTIDSDVGLFDRLRGFKRLELLLDSSDAESTYIIGKEKELIELRDKLNDLLSEEQPE